jgi:hypothetical protein
MEGFHAGLAWALQLPTRPRYTSPWIDPYTLRLQHLEVSTLLAELLWTFDNVALRADGDSKPLEWALPTERREIARRLLDAERIFDPTGAADGWPIAEASPNEASAPVKAPPAAKLIDALLSVGAQDAVDARSTELQYLAAMGWASVVGDAVQLTTEGAGAAAAWAQLGSDDAEAWCAWIDRAAAAIARLPTVQELVSASSPGCTDDALAKRMKRHKRSVGAQAALAANFGATVRLNGKNWAAAPNADPETDAAVVLATMQQLQRDDASRSAAVGADRLFTALLRNAPLPLHRFRRAILRLVESGHVEPGGSTQVAGPADAVRIRTVVPGPDGKTAELHLVDLGRGTFLVPNASSQALTPTSAREAK